MKKKVVLIGWDAADWNIINPLLEQGKLPTLAKLMKKGVHGNLSTMNPPYSPMLWTSIATGKTPDKHGVLGFLELDAEKQTVRPVTVTQRKVKAIWNILHNQGYRSNLIGWWPSHPAEPINGVIISDQFTNLKGEYNEPWPLVEGSVHPKNIEKYVKDLRMHGAEVTTAHILPFMPLAERIDQAESKSIMIIAKILSQNVSIHAASTWAMENTEWDFTGVYYDLIDHMCHAFMKCHPPRHQKISPEEFEIYKDVVNGAY
ncbi:MAG: alkaline phosphatase family protein, partial [Crocinitomicaceae bacterium]|nr:alkaline phosphatase family protein [Crocinitomicaceae bacterium]